jgi:hypothetical protein
MINAIDTRGMFDISDDIEIKEENGVILIDNIYKNPFKVREFILGTPAPIWKYSNSTKNFKEYYDCRHRIYLAGTPLEKLHFIAANALYKYLGVEVIFPTPDNFFISNVFQDIKPDNRQILRNAIPHIDGYDANIQVALIIPLNLDNEGYSETTFFNLKAGEYLDNYEHLRVSNQLETGEDYYAKDLDIYWGKTKSVKHKFNQAVLFEGNIPHSAGHWGFNETPRINQVSFF